MIELTPYESRNRSIYNPFREFSDLWGWTKDFKTDISETKQAFLIEAELPGFQRENIDIHIEQNQLTISARRTDESKQEEQGSYVRRERTCGTVVRTFNVSGIQADAIDAKYQDGILKIYLPKKQESQQEVKKIEIH